jgi:uncharacterized protein YraI
MMRKWAMTAVLGLALLVPAAAWAQTAYTNRDVNLRAGPNRDFPLVLWIPAGVPVFVNGCIDGFTWCDVSVGEDRGWVYADFLSYDYFGQPVTIISGGALLGLPLVTFSIAPYWDSYYRFRPWYGNRYYWYGRPPTWWHHAPPPPRPPVVRPPPPRPPNWYRPGQRPPEWNQPPQRPPEGNRPSQPRPPTVNPPSSRPAGPGGSRPPQAAPEYSRSAPPTSSPRPMPQSKPDVRPAPQPKPDVRSSGSGMQL